METVNINFIERAIINFAGFDPETIKNTTSAEKKRIVTMGLTLLVPVLLGACSGGYAITLLSKNPYAWAFGLVYACIIYLIDRAMLSISKPSWVTNLGRIVLALVVGLVVSFPVKLWFFQDAIKEELHKHSESKTQVIRDKYQRLINIIDTDLTARRASVETYHQAWMTEMDGTGGTEKHGRGNIADVKEGEFNTAQRGFNTYNSVKEVEKDSLVREMQGELLKMSEAHAVGFIGQYNALARVAAREPLVKFATYLLWAFFTLLELVPLLVKIASSGNLYDSVVNSTNNAKLLSIENTNVLKAEAETMAQKKPLQAKMNNVKLEMAMNDVDIETKMAEMYIQKLVEMSKNETKKTKELSKLDIEDAKKSELMEKIASISDYYGERVYRTPFDKQALYDSI